MYLLVPEHLCIAACWILGTSLEESLKATKQQPKHNSFWQTFEISNSIQITEEEMKGFEFVIDVCFSEYYESPV